MSSLATAYDPLLESLPIALRSDLDASELATLGRLLEGRESCWRRHVPAFEKHGILGLFARNLERAGVSIPADVAERVHAMGEDAIRAALTLERFLDGAREGRIEVILLKGSDLAHDLHRERGLRAQGDIDVLLDRRDLGAAVAAARAAGLVASEDQLPLWWYRLAHFHLKLHPATPLLKELELHWHLHHPALLLEVRPRDLWSRSRAIPGETPRVRSLDRLDRFLHLATHLASHWGRAAPRNGPALVAELLEEPDPPVRLKWLVDLASLAERHADSLPTAGLVERAATWGAEPALAGIARLLVETQLVSLPTADWLRSLREGLPRERASDRAPARRSRGHRPHAALDFRLEALDLLPAWIWPPLGVVRRRYRLGSGAIATAAAGVARPLHALGVIAWSALCAAALPVALAARRLLRGRRRRERARALDPDAALDLAMHWRRIAAREG